MKKGFAKLMSVITASALLISAVSGIGVWKGKEASAFNVVLEKPIIKNDTTNTMLSGQKVTWDCVYFGSYPQAEVVSSAAITALNTGWYDGKDIEVNPNLYSILANSAAQAWHDDEIIINTVKYRRMRAKDALYQVAPGATDGYYQWKDSSAYHYFKYEPIKWRVLSTDGKKALLLADTVLDNRYYDQSNKEVTWGNCSVRSWLNGYNAAQNLAAVNYTNTGFINVAFDANEAGAILETELINNQGNRMRDKVFLLSQSELSKTPAAQSYGFRESESYDEARISYCSTYAKAMGVQFVIPPASGEGERARACGYLLRNDEKASDFTMCTLPNGQFRTVANAYKISTPSRLYQSYAIRPALYLDLSQTARYDYAGTVCSDNTSVNAQTAATGRVTLPPATQSPSRQPTNSPFPTFSFGPYPSTSVSPTPSASFSPAPSSSASPSVVPTQQPSVSPNTVPTQQPSVTGNPQVLQTPTPGEPIIIEKTVYKGKRFKDEETMGVYKITKTGENGTVIYLRPLDKTQGSVTIPDTVEYQDDTYRVVAVGEHAFYKNKDLYQITLGNNVTKISNRAFYKCTNLEEIDFNGNLKRIGTKAFFRCNSLEEIVLPSKVEHIGVRAFYKCKNLQKAVLPKNLLELGTKSFYKCKKLNVDMRRVERRHIAMGRKPFTGVKRVRYGNVQTRP